MDKEEVDTYTMEYYPNTNKENILILKTNCKKNIAWNILILKNYWLKFNFSRVSAFIVAEASNRTSHTTCAITLLLNVDTVPALLPGTEPYHTLLEDGWIQGSH